MSIPAATITERNDAPANTATTYQLGLHEVFQGRVGSAADSDWIRVSLTAGQTYVFSMWGTSGGLSDTVLTLRNSSGIGLASNDDASEYNRFSLVTYTPSATGTYYLQAAAYGAETGAYRLRVSTDEYTVDEVASQLIEFDWSEPWPLAFDAEAFSTLTVNLTALTAAGKQLARWALETWSMVTSIAFVETAAASAAIVFDDNQAGAFAGPSSYDPSTGEIIRSNVNVSASWLASYGTTIDSYSFTTYVHEIGHALGLGHPGLYDGAATYGESNHFRNDSTLMSVMSYFSPQVNPYYASEPGEAVTPMPADVVAMRQLYGTAAIHPGNTVWGAGSNVGGMLGRLFGHLFDGEPDDPEFYTGGPVYFTIADNGGIDLLDLSTVTGNVVIDMTPGSFVRMAHSQVPGFAIAPGTVIEHLRTGSGSDQIQGNDAANRIRSGGGDWDVTRGGGGNDTLIGGAGGDLLLGQEGDDLLFLDEIQVRHFAASSDRVYRLYLATLDRVPDVAGHMGWTTQIGLGDTTPLGAAAGFVASAEFQTVYGALGDAGFVSLMYQNVLGRTAAQAEIDAWLALMQNGQSRAQVALGFSDSQEFIRATQVEAQAWTQARSPAAWSDELFRLYGATLDRLPDMTGLTGWAERLAAGSATLASVASGFVGSIEFQNVYGALDNAGFVSLMYRNVLDRVAAQAEIDAWLARMAGGESRAQVVLGFSESAEFIRATSGSIIDWFRGFDTRSQVEGGEGSNLLAGGMGADWFVFSAQDGGNDRAVGFEAWDLVELRHFGYADAHEALTHFSQVGRDVLFQDDGVRVVFENTTLATFDTETVSVWS